MTDIFETEPFKAYDEKIKALMKAMVDADTVVVEKLESEAELLKLNLVKAEAKRCGYAA